MFLVWLSVKYWMQPATAHLNRLASEHDPCRIYWHASTPMEKAVVNQLRCFFTEIWVSTVIHNSIHCGLTLGRLWNGYIPNHCESFPNQSTGISTAWKRVWIHVDLPYFMSKPQDTKALSTALWKFIFTRLWKSLAGPACLFMFWCRKSSPLKLAHKPTLF